MRFCNGAGELDARGFPPRLDLFKATVAESASQQESPSLPVNLGPTWIRGFPRRRPEFRTKFAVLRGYQRLHASHPTPICDYFNKLGAVLQKYNFQPYNMYNMDEKGFQLGVHNRAKVVVRHRCRTPIEKMDGCCEWITVVEYTCADDSMLPPMVIYKGKDSMAGLQKSVIRMRNLRTLLKAIWPTSWKLSGCRPLISRQKSMHESATVSPYGWSYASHPLQP